MATSSEIERVRRECFDDPILFAMTFFAHKFPTPIPWFHRAIFAILTRKVEFLERYGELDKIEKYFININPGTGEKTPLFFWHKGVFCMQTGQFTNVVIPRGFSKTTICGNVVPIYCQVYRLKRFILYVSAAERHSWDQLDAVKREYDTNAKLVAIYGSLVPPPGSNARWAADQFQLANGCVMVARGRNGAVRGLKVGDTRPDLVIVDDLEDKESVKTPESRQKTNQFWIADLKPVINQFDPDAGFFFLGTKLHNDALLMVHRRDPDFTSVVLDAEFKSGEMLWDVMMSKAKLERAKLAASNAGELQSFYMEYLPNWDMPEEGKLFRRSQFKHGMPEDLTAYRFAIACDPAISSKKKADDAVIFVAGMGPRGQICLVDCWYKHGATPRDIVDNFMRMAKQWKCQIGGIEANAYQAALVHLVVEEMHRPGNAYYFEVKAVTHTTKKEERIKGVLQPRYAAGYITHARPFPKLEYQLEEFPMADHDDHPDCAAQAVALLDPYAAAAAGEDLAKDTMEPLGDLEEFR